MSSVNTLPSDYFGYSGERTSGLEILPTLLTLPGGQIYACFLLLRADRRIRHGLKTTRALLHNGFDLLPMEARERCAKAFAGWANEHQSCLKTLEPKLRRNFVLRFLLARLNHTLEESSDIAETFALGADPEIDRLARELSDVL